MSRYKFINSKRDSNRSIVIRSDEHIGDWIDKLREWALEENESLIVMLESADMLEQLQIEKSETVTKCHELQEQIERMAEFISKMDIDESICKKIDMDCNADYSMNDTYRNRDEYCASCIIKYFENKTE